MTEQRPVSPLDHIITVSRSDSFLLGGTPSAASNCKDSAVKDTYTEQRTTDLASVLATASTTLHRSFYVLIVVALYALLALFAWTVTCIFTDHPITTKSYAAVWEPNHWGNSNLGPSSPINSLYVKNRRWYRVARVLQSIVRVLTIPITSAVCSSAAVIFVQYDRQRRNLTMRQVMNLADKG